ncbi:hypothetical protein DSM104329_02516 [Capillimicrobium parvum]|uniref:Uncharacterized protein n=1 Tax=Capillimicrobium parvum TaxID=2884022 RepID=A0A9E6XXA4_9ACTN|nr:hypothetical protein DSM104329_02516 [Capillimicrobium parvum]
MIQLKDPAFPRVFSHPAPPVGSRVETPRAGEPGRPSRRTRLAPQGRRANLSVETHPSQQERYPPSARRLGELEPLARIDQRDVDLEELRERQAARSCRCSRRCRRRPTRPACGACGVAGRRDRTLARPTGPQSGAPLSVGDASRRGPSPDSLVVTGLYRRRPPADVGGGAGGRACWSRRASRCSPARRSARAAPGTSGCPARAHAPISSSRSSASATSSRGSDPRRASRRGAPAWPAGSGTTATGPSSSSWYARTVWRITERSVQWSGAW